MQGSLIRQQSIEIRLSTNGNRKTCVRGTRGMLFDILFIWSLFGLWLFLFWIDNHIKTQPKWKSYLIGGLCGPIVWIIGIVYFIIVRVFEVYVLPVISKAWDKFLEFDFK